MAEKPEQVLPQQRRATRMRLQAIADHETGGDKEARARDPVENQQDARRHEDGERDQPMTEVMNHAHVAKGRRASDIPRVRRSASSQ